MRTLERPNWIDGRWQPARGELWFERHARVAPFAPLARWPRSGAADVYAALEACRRAQATWAELSRLERSWVLARVPALLETRRDLGAELAAALGLEEGEFAARFERDLFRLREGLELAAEAPDRPGVGLFQAHWSDLAGGLAARLAANLLAGRTAVLFSDPKLPRAAEAAVQALEEAGLPRGVVALLHGDHREALEVALALPAGGPDWVRLRDLPERVARWALLSRTARPGRDESLWPLRNRSHVVAEAASPPAEAETVLELALGRSATMSGQCPGHIARVLCHQRLFSRFSEELLERLARSEDRPVPALEEDLPRYVQEVWSLGLDEGAAPIFGSAPEDASSGAGPFKTENGVPPGEPGRGPLLAHAPRTVGAVVFTNVEPRHALAGLARPAPVLLLLRVPSDEHGRELAERLDAS